MATGDPIDTGPAPSFRIPVTYSDMFFGEWNQEKTRHFMENTHLPVSFAITAVYLLMVKYGPKIMENRKAFDLRKSLAAWNLALFAYSAASFIILWPHLTKSYYKGGILGTICYNDDLYTHPVSGWYGWLYCMSKANNQHLAIQGPELIDTVFLILRKRPVIFLHWYHHSMTFLMGQIFYTEFVPWVRPGVMTNLAVHTIMYLYYAIRAWGVKTDRWVSKIITLTQIAQFMSGGIYGLHMFHAYLNDGLENCVTKVDKIGLGTIVVGSYLYLFMKYFREAYGKNDSPPKKIEESADEKEIKKVQ